MGVAFGHHSERQKIQPSLSNIYKELENDGFRVNRKSGDLTKWVEQGVFLYNTTLTVRQGQANSHRGEYDNFTNNLFSYLNRVHDHLVVIMWGSYAKSYKDVFDRKKHKGIVSVHPSPYSADKGFFGSKPFSETNKYLREWGKKPIDWNLD